MVQPMHVEYIKSPFMSIFAPSCYTLASLICCLYARLHVRAAEMANYVSGGRIIGRLISHAALGMISQYQYAYVFWPE